MTMKRMCQLAERIILVGALLLATALAVTMFRASHNQELAKETAKKMARPGSVKNYTVDSGDVKRFLWDRGNGNSNTLTIYPTHESYASFGAETKFLVYEGRLLDHEHPSWPEAYLKPEWALLQFRCCKAATPELFYCKWKNLYKNTWTLSSNILIFYF